VPKKIRNQLLAADPVIVDLKRQFKALNLQIRHKYKFIKRAPKKIREKYTDLSKQLINTKKSLKNEINKKYRKDYFFRIHNKKIERQLNKTIAEEPVEPIIKYQFEERILLQRILCNFSKDLSIQDIVDRKVRAINLMIALVFRQKF
jgi:hypothetical protein